MKVIVGFLWFTAFYMCIQSKGSLLILGIGFGACASYLYIRSKPQMSTKAFWTVEVIAAVAAISFRIVQNIVMGT